MMNGYPKGETVNLSQSLSKEYWAPRTNAERVLMDRLVAFCWDDDCRELEILDGEVLLELCRRMNVQPIVYDLIQQYALSRIPHGPWFQTLRSEALKIAGSCAYQQHSIRTVTQAFRENGLQPILLKGPALATTVYPHQHWRTFQDIDLLIAPREWDQSVSLVESLGYASVPCLNWNYLSFEKSFHPIESLPESLSIELHSRLSNRTSLCVFDYAALAADAIRDSGDDLQAWIPHPIKHFIFVCLHRMGHHAVDRRFIWLLDMHYMVRSFGEGEWDALIQCAHQGRISQLLHRSLTDLQSVIPSPIPDRIFQALSNQPQEVTEPSAVYLRDDRSKWQDLWARWWEMHAWFK